MRRTVSAGLLLVVATGLTLLVGEALDLEVASVALLGVSVGAVVALVPDQTIIRRLAGFALGFVAAFVGYLIRAAVLPDTDAGRAVAASLVVLLCVGVAAISAGRLPLWSALIGAASFAGAYEYTYVQAPTRVLDTSVSSATMLLLCVAVGFLVAALTAEAPADENERSARTDEETSRLDDMMETKK